MNLWGTDGSVVKASHMPVVRQRFKLRVWTNGKAKNKTEGTREEEPFQQEKGNERNLAGSRDGTAAH